MIITIVNDVLVQENNGTAITCFRLIKKLKERGHEVRVLSPLKKDEPGFYTLPTRNFYMFNNYVAKNGVALAKPDKDIIRKAIEGSDLVHVMVPFKAGIEVMKIAHELHIPVTGATHVQAENVTSHFFLQNVPLANKYVYKRFYNKFYKYLDYVHCPTQFIKNTVKKNGYDMNIRVISNGVDAGYHYKKVEKPKEYENKFVILTVGRLAREKRHDLLIKAIKLSKHEEKIQLIIAGCGPLEKKTIRRAKKLTNKANIGFHTQEELVDIINYSDLYVHPADVEIEAISCLEAISCGLVPIISDSKKSATNHFALHKDNLFKARDAQDLANKIDYMIEHPKIKEKMSKEYLDYSREFEIEHCIDEMEKMFNDAIKDYKDEKK